MSSFTSVDFVLGGGIMPGGVILIGGEPGIGKSTLLMQIANGITEEILYISAEESASQFFSRARRLGISSEKISFSHQASLSAIKAVISKNTKLVVIDSVQAIYDSEISSFAGSVIQVRQCSYELARVAKEKNISVIMVGHVTKDGNFAGPKLLEHLVDVMLSFEADSESGYRILRSTKNRFGSVNEIAIFDMQKSGLKEIMNPSAFLLDKKIEEGTCTNVLVEGNRTFLSQVQALAINTSFSLPRRVAIGYELNRVHMIVAIMSRFVHKKISLVDIYINVVGGLKVIDTSMDLSIACAIISSVLNKPISSDVCVIGELGLSGEIRAVKKAQERLKEALSRGFKSVYLPAGNVIKSDHVYHITHIKDLPRTLWRDNFDFKKELI